MKKVIFTLSLFAALSCTNEIETKTTVESDKFSTARGGIDNSFGYGDVEGLVETNDGTTFTPVLGEIVIFSGSGCAVVSVGGITYTVTWRAPKVIIKSTSNQPAIYETPGKGEVMYRGMIFSTTLGSNC